MRISQNLSSFYRPLTLCDVNIAQCSDWTGLIDLIEPRKNGFPAKRRNRFAKKMEFMQKKTFKFHENTESLKSNAKF